MNKKKKRTYEKDPRKKIKKGESWRLTLVVDDDNAANVLKEVEESEVGANYQGVINKRIRQAYSK